MGCRRQIAQFGRVSTIDFWRDPQTLEAVEYYCKLPQDLADRDVYLCGPVGLLDRLERTLRDLGVPGRQVHIERFAY